MSRPTKVLIVDDSPEVRRMVKRTLEREFDVVGEVDDGVRAAAEVASTGAEIVVMDFKMPTVNGDEATAQIKELFPQVIVVAFTAWEGQHAGEMLEAGAEAVFSKNDLTGLLEFIRNVSTSD